MPLPALSLDVGQLVSKPNRDGFESFDQPDNPDLEHPTGSDGKRRIKHLRCLAIPIMLVLDLRWPATGLFTDSTLKAYPDRPLATNCIARWKIGNIGNIVVHQQFNRQQIGNRPATSATFLEPIPQIGKGSAEVRRQLFTVPTLAGVPQAYA